MASDPLTLLSIPQKLEPAVQPLHRFAALQGDVPCPRCGGLSSPIELALRGYCDVCESELAADAGQ